MGLNSLLQRPKLTSRYHTRCLLGAFFAAPPATPAAPEAAAPVVAPIPLAGPAPRVGGTPVPGEYGRALDIRVRTVRTVVRVMGSDMGAEYIVVVI